MRKTKTSRAGQLFLLLAILLGACTKEVEIPVSPEVPQEENSGGLEIVLQTPQPDKVVTRVGDGEESGGAEDHPVIHEVQEWTVKKLGVYIFKKKASGGDTDADYTLVKKTEGITFVPEAEAGTGEDLPENQGIDKGNGIYSYTEPIEDCMMNGTLQIFLVANEGELASVTANEEGTSGTPLSDFKKLVATAKLTDDNASSDVISGGKYDFSPEGNNDAYTGIVMSAVAYKGESESSENRKIVLSQTPQDLKLKATLVRDVARIDIRMNKRALVLKKAVLKNAASEAYLFAQETTEEKTKAPIDSKSKCKISSRRGKP